MTTKNSTAFQRAAFTIREFCERQGFSAPVYYKMRAKGLGPAELRVDGLVRITAESEAEWQRARTHRVGSEAETADRDALARRERAKKAAASSTRARLG
jgi:hypothetical protein